MPSVRKVAAETTANPLTVGKAYQGLLEAGIIRARHGIGYFVTDGGSERLRVAERLRFLSDHWPSTTAEIKRLHLSREDLLAEEGVKSG